MPLNGFNELNFATPYLFRFDGERVEEWEESLGFDFSTLSDVFGPRSRLQAIFGQTFHHPRKCSGAHHHAARQIGFVRTVKNPTITSTQRPGWWEAKRGKLFEPGTGVLGTGKWFTFSSAAQFSPRSWQWKGMGEGEKEKD